KRKAGERHFFAGAGVAKQRLLLTRIGDAETAALAIPGGEAERHEAAFDQSLSEKSVEGAKHVRGARLLRSQTAHGADGNRAIKSRGASLPADVAERDSQVVGSVTHEVVEVAAQLARRNDARGNVETKFRSGQSGQQCPLNSAGGVQVALHAAFIARHLFVESCVF